MTSRLVRTCLAALFAALSYSLSAQPQATLPPPVVADDPIIPEVKLPNAELETILPALELYTGKTVLRPGALPTPPGGFNLMLSTPRRAGDLR